MFFSFFYAFTLDLNFNVVIIILRLTSSLELTCFTQNPNTLVSIIQQLSSTLSLRHISIVLNLFFYAYKVLTSYMNNIRSLRHVVFQIPIVARPLIFIRTSFAWLFWSRDTIRSFVTNLRHRSLEYFIVSSTSCHRTEEIRCSRQFTYFSYSKVFFSFSPFLYSNKLYWTHCQKSHISVSRSSEAKLLLSRLLSFTWKKKCFSYLFSDFK